MAYWKSDVFYEIHQDWTEYDKNGNPIAPFGRHDNFYLEQTGITTDGQIQMRLVRDMSVLSLSLARATLTLKYGDVIRTTSADGITNTYRWTTGTTYGDFTIPSSWAGKSVTWNLSVDYTSTQTGTITIGAYGQFSLSIKSSNATTSVSRTSSPQAGESTGAIANGAAIYSGDNLQISSTAKSGYKLIALSAAGVSIKSGDTVTVEGDTEVIATATPNESTVKAPDTTIGESVTITITKYYSTYKTTLAYQVNNAGSYTQIGTAKTSADSVNFTVPNVYSSLSATSTYVPIKLRCTTYDENGSKVGDYTYYTFKALAKTSEIQPVIPAPTITDEKGYYGTYGKYISGKSTIKISVSKSDLQFKYGATFKSIKITLSNSTYTSTSTSATTFSTSKTANYTYPKYTIVVTDSRDVSTTQTGTLDIFNYYPPSIKDFKVIRTSTKTATTENENGTYLRVTPSINAPAVGSPYAVTSKVSVKTTSGAYSAAATVSSTGATTLSTEYSPDTTYIVLLTITDPFGESDTRTVRLASRQWAMKFMANGNGVAFGKAAEHNATLEIPGSWDFKIGDTAINETQLNALRDLSPNLITYPYVYKKDRTSNGITYTINNDGSVTANGTATGNNSFNFTSRVDLPHTVLIPGKEYILSGCPSGGGSTTYELAVNYTKSGATSGTTIAHDYGSTAKFTAPEDAESNYFGCYIYIWKGTVCNNVTFKPMINIGNTVAAYVSPKDTASGLNNRISALEDSSLLNNRIILSSGTYGTTLPSSGVTGQVFFLKVT